MSLGCGSPAGCVREGLARVVSARSLASRRRRATVCSLRFPLGTAWQPGCARRLGSYGRRPRRPRARSRFNTSPGHCRMHHRMVVIQACPREALRRGLSCRQASCSGRVRSARLAFESQERRQHHAMGGLGSVVILGALAVGLMVSSVEAARLVITVKESRSDWRRRRADFRGAATNQAAICVRDGERHRHVRRGGRGGVWANKQFHLDAFGEALLLFAERQLQATCPKRSCAPCCSKQQSNSTARVTRPHSTQRGAPLSARPAPQRVTGRADHLCLC